MRKYISLLGLTLLLLAAGRAPAQEEEDAQTVFIVPIKGMIERGLLYAVRRGLEEAKAQNADAVIIDMDTPGGKLQSAEEIVLLLLDLPMPTYTFVNPRAISAGAIISIATDRIYMTPSGLIGDAMPIMMSPLPMGGAQEVPDGLKEKIMSPTIALVRSAAQAKGHDPLVGEAMIRPEMEYKIGDKMICKEGQLLTLTSQDAIELVAEKDEVARPLLASGIVESLDDLLEEVGLSGAQTVTIEVTGAERIARVIEGFPVSGILLALGLLGLYIEFKTPGFGLPGLAGLICLALWFWGHHIAGLAGLGELVLFLLGVILLMLEIFVVPGFGLTGVSGLACIVAAIFLAMVQHYPGRTFYVPRPMQIDDAIKNVGTAMVLVFALGAAITRYLPKTSLFRRIMLTSELDREAGYTASSEREELVGLEGVAGSALRPAGIGTFGDKRLNVVARGEFIEKDTPIVVAETHGNRIVVDIRES